MNTFALLVTACLFGGMSFFSFGFAPVLFKQLSVSQVRPLLRGTFPYYYLAIMVFAIIAALSAMPSSMLVAALLGFIFVSTAAARQILMPAINDATDGYDKKRFNLLHGLSVVVQLVQIGLCGWSVVILAQSI